MNHLFINKIARFSLLLSLLAFVLAGCIKPFQPDIQQGNILNNSDLREIQAGMSKQEVLFILGTPLVIDPFNEERWDYYYSNTNKRKNETTTRLITAVFEGDTLTGLHGDVDLNSVKTLEPSTEDMQHGGTVITEPTHKEKGLFNRIFKKRNKFKNKAKEADKDSDNS